MKDILIKASGYIDCKSEFYSVFDTINEHNEYHFYPGINRLTGEIDSEIFGISYLMSMYGIAKKEIILDESVLNVTVDNTPILLSELSKRACYMDKSYYMFSSKRTAKDIIRKSLKKQNKNRTAEEICDLFAISRDRFDRSVRASGNERYKLMAAIAYAQGKDIFCFPWFSKKRFEYFHENLTGLLDVLESLKKIVILPTGF